MKKTMKKTLGTQKSTEIVVSVLTDQIRAFDLDSFLGELLQTEDERKLFQQTVHARVKSHGFKIKLADIPIKPDVTIKHIASKLAALPGDPVTPGR